MIKTITKKLYLTDFSSFQETELPGRPYIIANQDIEIVQEKIAVIRYTRSISNDDVKKCLDTAISMGFKSFYLFGITLSKKFTEKQDLINSLNIHGYGDGEYNHQVLPSLFNKGYLITLFMPVNDSRICEYIHNNSEIQNVVTIKQ